MRIILTAAAFAATFAVTAANAEPTYVQGGPERQGNLCNISTTGGDAMFGYVAPCAPQAQATKKKRS